MEMTICRQVLTRRDLLTALLPRHRIDRKPGKRTVHTKRFAGNCLDRTGGPHKRRPVHVQPGGVLGAAHGIGGHTSIQTAIIGAHVRDVEV